MRGDHLGGRESSQGGDVPEGDPDELGVGLGDEGVPGDGGGHQGEGGHQGGQVRQLFVSQSQPGPGQSLGGEDVVSAGGDSSSLDQSREGFLRSKEKSDDTGLHHRPSDEDRRALSHNLTS